jgi:hypothetical protein
MRLEARSAHFRESGNPSWFKRAWIPAFAGASGVGRAIHGGIGFS